MGIASILKNNYIKVEDKNIIVISKDNEIVFSMLITDINRTQWGQIYEKMVGQYYEQLGYYVKYNGLELGFKDGGIDLICKGRNVVFVQCKCYQKSKIALQEIESILYRAGNFISRYGYEKKDEFVIAVPNVSKIFKCKEVKNKR